MISCYQGQIEVVISLVTWFDFDRNVLLLWPTCSAFLSGQGTCGPEGSSAVFVVVWW